MLPFVKWLFLSVAFILVLVHANADSVASLPTPTDAIVRDLVVPAGFQASLFAAEPDVVQPVAMNFDDRGRLWVVEMLTYSNLKTNFDITLRDRVVILEDTNGDGQADRRTVFWEGGQRVTSVEIGFGGVWLLAAPNLLFIPDKDKNDIPDGPPETLLNGWDAGPVRHNIVNGLKWGPDGWLYGRHGILATSNVGRPGTPDSERVRLNCCIWRYQPVRKTFEVVCHGTTNPWGHDWDQYGRLWFINTVIGHLWEAIPGAWYKRMYGEHLAPHRYQLIDQHADHYHWNTSKSWTDSRAGANGADSLGGGHAHSGLMIYLGDNWPSAYRNELFTLNFHGRRINQEHLDTLGSGFRGSHKPDFARFPDPWFRGVDLAYGPDGSVFVLDWSDTGECHENDADGVHQDTGRIYQIRYGKKAQEQSNFDLNKNSDVDLVRLQLHQNEWWVRHARRNLQERFSTGKDMSGARELLRKMFAEQKEETIKLRLLWALHAVGATQPQWLKPLLTNEGEHVRSWAIQLLTETDEHSPETRAWLVQTALNDGSARVRLSLASSLQRMSLEDRLPLGRELLKHKEDAEDHNLPLLIWYGIEPSIAAGLPAAISLYKETQIPLLRQFIARLITERVEKSPADLEAMLRWTYEHPSPSTYLDILRGVDAAFRGWRKAPQPSNWETFSRIAGQLKNEEIARHLQELGVVFGDGLTIEKVRQIAFDPKADNEARRTALRQLINAKINDLDSVLEVLIREPVLTGLAARGLATSASEDAAKAIVKFYNKLLPEEQRAIIDEWTGRVTSSKVLLNAVSDGIIPRSSLNAMHARQILHHGEVTLSNRLTQVWGQIRTESDKQLVIAHFKELLPPAQLEKADLPHGRQIFERTCSVCHQLYGEGKQIGPDLTGSGRSSLDYLLENIIDPSGMVPSDFQVTNLELKDGRSISGVIVERSERTIEIQTQTEKIRVDRNEIVQLQSSNLSLMPDGLLEALHLEEVRDLIAYLMHPKQVNKR